MDRYLLGNLLVSWVKSHSPVKAEALEPPVALRDGCFLLLVGAIADRSCCSWRRVDAVIGIPRQCFDAVIKLA